MAKIDTTDWDPLPMAADIEATKRKGRRQLMLIGAIVLGIVVLLAGVWFGAKILVPAQDVAAARACNEFEVEVGIYPLSSPNTSAIKETASEQTGKWVRLGTLMTEAATAYENAGPVNEDLAGATRAVESAVRVLEECRNVSSAAHLVASNSQ